MSEMQFKVMGFSGSRNPLPEVQVAALREVMESFLPEEGHHGDCKKVAHRARSPYPARL